MIGRRYRGQPNAATAIRREPGRWFADLDDEIDTLATNSPAKRVTLCALELSMLLRVIRDLQRRVERLEQPKAPF